MNENINKKFDVKNFDYDKCYEEVKEIASYTNIALFQILYIIISYYFTYFNPFIGKIPT